MLYQCVPVKSSILNGVGGLSGDSQTERGYDVVNMLIARFQHKELFEPSSKGRLSVDR